MTHVGNRVKVQISLTPELLEKLDAYCKAIGVTRSAFVQTTLGQTLYGLGVVQQTVNDSLTNVAQKMAEEKE
jgi:hypothetical protein